MDKVDKKFIKTLEKRFKENMHRHKHIKWDFVESSLYRSRDLYEAVYLMEETGGEPDLVDLGVFKGLVYVDMAKESPVGRRALCYDKKARTERKDNPAKSSAEEEAEKMGVKILDEDQYYGLAELEDIDTKSSSWILSPEEVRARGGALFCSLRYNRIFTYHNKADSYYKSRAFRAYVKI